MFSTRFRCVAAAIATALLVPPAIAQEGPVNGMRQGEIRTHALVGGRVFVAPGNVIDPATIVFRDGVIVAAGADVEIPAGARVWDVSGHTVYPGLVDAAVFVDAKDAIDAATSGSGAHWNERVHPQVRMADLELPDDEKRKALRELGFAVAAVYPSTGIFRGEGAVLAMADERSHVLDYVGRRAMAIAFEHGGSWTSAGYPGALMGAISLVRQTLLDAAWDAESRRVWSEHPQGNRPPIRADALTALEATIAGTQPVLFDVDDELDALRAAVIADAFDLDVTLFGSGLEFRRLDAIVGLGMPLVVPLKFPKTPDVSTLTRAEQVTLRDMMTWELAPANVERLIDAGATVAITSARLDSAKDFRRNLGRALTYGLDEVDALRALTVTPARLLGLDDVLGTLEPGKAANVLVVEGSYFDDDAKIRDLWINGRRHVVSRRPEFAFAPIAMLRADDGFEATVTIDAEHNSVELAIAGDDEETTVRAKKAILERGRIGFVVPGDAMDAEGSVRFAGVIVGETIEGAGERLDGRRFGFTMTPIPGDAGDEDDHEDDEPPPDELAELVYPLGAYGVAAAPEPRDVLVTNATIWTCGPAGIVANGGLLVRDGKIAAVIEDMALYDPPGDVEIIDARGGHVTPGLIDCHSHTGVSGGVNEWTQVNTAEVGIADVVNPDDVNWYRQLAGGLTVANQLHGSANPIGGQNSVVKLKWGGLAEDFRVDDAMGGIKFALGENVVRKETRYPNTRMGVETVLRDAFTAAEAYRDEWQRYEALPASERARRMPPRRDLELETLVEILEHERLIHCHSYRQDEILMLIRLAESFGFTLGTLQHILEGYKVGEALAAHGVGASSFSDWWAYKVEVQDAIPFNGALMHSLGILVSFNSDSSEVARRMNTEAAKAVRYGGVEPHEALKFVTLHPAMQLRVDHRVGSLEAGKDADFAIWSGDPLSTYTRCRQTWIEGACYFNEARDAELREVIAAERQRLIAKILDSSDRSRRKSKKKMLEQIESGTIELPPGTPNATGTAQTTETLDARGACVVTDDEEDAR